MELENQEYERWKKWAERETELFKQKNAAMYTGGVQNEDAALDADEGELDAAAEEVSDQIPAKGQSALEGALLHP